MQGTELLCVGQIDLAMNWKKVGWTVAIALLAVLVIAWIDGGEEPLRPIETSIAVPGAVQ